MEGEIVDARIVDKEIDLVVKVRLNQPANEDAVSAATEQVKAALQMYAPHIPVVSIKEIGVLRVPLE